MLEKNKWYTADQAKHLTDFTFLVLYWEEHNVYTGGHYDKWSDIFYNNDSKFIHGDITKFMIPEVK